MRGYHRPTRLADALALLADDKRAPVILCGGTDVYPARTGRQAWGEPVPQDCLDISALPELRGICQGEHETVIGAATPWSEIAQASLPPAFDGLRQAARQVGGLQVQNRASIAGNLCNASPAADGVPPLLTLGALLSIESRRGKRVLPLDAFILGNRKTALQADEMVTAIHMPHRTGQIQASFHKLGTRCSLVISIVSIALLIESDAAGCIAHAAIAVGACSAVPQRLSALEAALRGQACKSDLAMLVEAQHLSKLSPIDDVRASADYRRKAVMVLLKRALQDVARKEQAKEA
jgi:CO/xanthine dehydrogenase FAD-binding subunit